MAWAAYRGTQAMRQALFRRVMEAHPDLFTSHSSSALTNIVAHEAQGGAVMLSNSGLALVRDLLTLVALFTYLLWMNWQLTLFVVVLFPVVAYAMRTLSRRLHRLTLEGQSASDQLAYAVEENVLAWRIVRLHNAQQQQTQRFNEMSDQMRRVSMKSVVAAGRYSRARLPSGRCTSQAQPEPKVPIAVLVNSSLKDAKLPKVLPIAFVPNC